jgi:hypothetical protein
MSEEEKPAKPARQPKPGDDLAARIRAQQDTPGNPTPQFAQSTMPGGQPAVSAVAPVPMPQPAEKVREKGPTRATHFVDEQGIEWVRTGITLPNSYLKGIIAYVNQRRLEWNVGDPRVTQQDIEVEAIGIWLNDHRSEIPAKVNAMCDEVREKLRHS